MIKYKLKKTYPNSPELGYEAWYEDLTSSEDWQGTTFYDNYPEYWEKVVEKDYEILSFTNGTDTFTKQPNGVFKHNWDAKDEGYEKGWRTEEHMLKNATSCRITSVKRKNDGKVFTLGDKIDINTIDEKNCVIENFYIWEGEGLAAKVSNSIIDAGVTIGCLEKSKKQKLFTTEDGKDIFEGENWFIVYTDDEEGLVRNGRELWKSCPNKGTKYSPQYKSIKRFSTHEKAEEYIFLNTKSLSINDLKNLRQQVENKIGLKLIEAAEQLVKSRIKL